MTVTKVNQHLIVADDCLSYMKTMTTQSVDCVVTSPPYNIGISYNSYVDKKPREAYILWLADIGREIARVLKPNGSYFLNLGSTNIDPWIDIDVANALRDIFVLQNRIVWVKSISIRNDTHGHFKPISSKRFLNQNHESIFHFTLSGNVEIDRLAVGVEFADKSNIARRNHSQDKRCAGNTRFIPYKTVQSKTQKYNHPASYPVELPEMCMKMHGNTGVVLDPFMGIGSTLIAADNLGWQGIGIDVDMKYVDISIERLTQNIKDIKC